MPNLPWRNCKKIGQIASQAGGRKAVEENADLNLERTFAAAAKNQRCSSYRQSSPSSPAGLRYRVRSARGKTVSPSAKAFVEVRENLSWDTSYPMHHSEYPRDRRLPPGSSHSRHSCGFRLRPRRSPARTCQTIWRDDTQIGVMFIQTAP